ncbi:type II toxin-antitoxin system antitoxin Xre [soil metagenome]
MSDAIFSYTPTPHQPTTWEQALGVGHNSVMELIDKLQSGLNAQAFERFSDLSGVPRDELAHALKVSTRTLQRRKEAGKPLDSGTSERLVRLAKLYARAAEVIGDDALAKQWMRTPRVLFEGKTPFEMATTELGAGEVEDLLLRTEHGVFS